MNYEILCKLGQSELDCYAECSQYSVKMEFL